MNLKELILKTRLIVVSMNQAKLITKLLISGYLARLSPSGANKQPLKYLYYNTAKECERIFPFLAWPGICPIGPDLKKEKDLLLTLSSGDKSISDIFGVDHGIAAHCIFAWCH